MQYKKALFQYIAINIINQSIFNKSTNKPFIKSSQFSYKIALLLSLWVIDSYKIPHLDNTTTCGFNQDEGMVLLKFYGWHYVVLEERC